MVELPNTLVGLLSFLVVTLSGVVTFLYRENRRLQDLRVNDAKEAVSKVAEPLSSVSQTIKLIYDRIYNGKEAI